MTNVINKTCPICNYAVVKLKKDSIFFCGISGSLEKSHFVVEYESESWWSKTYFIDGYVLFFCEDLSCSIYKDDQRIFWSDNFPMIASITTIEAIQNLLLLK